MVLVIPVSYTHLYNLEKAINAAKIMQIKPTLGKKKHTVVAHAKLEVVCPEGNE